MSHPLRVSAFLFVVVSCLLWTRSPALADLINVAPVGTATASTEDFGGVASRGNDGNTDGTFGAGSTTHTGSEDVAPTWEVDLGEDLAIEQIVVWNRTDCCSLRLVDFRITVIDSTAAETFSGDFFTAGDGTFPDPSFAADIPDGGALGQIVRVERLGPDSEGGLWLSLAEVEVFVDETALPPSILEHPRSASVERGSCHLFEVTLFNAQNAASITYEWRKDGVAIEGETDAALFLNNVTDDAAGEYSVVATADGRVLESDPAVLTVTLPNLARRGTASQSTTDFGGVAARAIDGNTNGVYGSNTVTHTGDEPGAWWEVDLGAPSAVASVVVWNRTDACCTQRLANIRVSVLDAERSELAGVDLFTDLVVPDLSATGAVVDVDVVGAQFVRIERLGAASDETNIVSLAEVQVFGEGEPAPIPANLARRCGARVRQSTTQSNFVAALGVDGNLDNFTHTVASDETPSWEAELPEETEIGSIVLHNRRSCCGSRLRDIIVTILDGSGDVAFESELLNPENGLGVFPNGPSSLRVDLQFGGPGVIVGKTVRVIRIPDPDFSGGGETPDEASVLSLAEVELFGPEDCPPEGDTHCNGLTIAGPEGNRPGAYTITADGLDDSGDDVLYTFSADDGAGGSRLLGPQVEPTAILQLGLGSWAVRVTADDNPNCPDEADDSVCEDTVNVVCDRGNLAIFGVATQSTTGFGGVPERAIDCNTDGVYNNGSMSHTADDDPTPYWQVDLQNSFRIDRVVLWNRTDCCADRLSNFQVLLLDDAGGLVWSSEFFTDGTSAGESFEVNGLRGERGRVIRIESLGPSPTGARFISLAEVEVYGLSCPISGDTHCNGLTVEEDGGSWLATADAVDDSGDEISYTFTATADGAKPISVGPQAENTARFDLTPGSWTVSVAVDDDPICQDVTGDAVCSTVVEVAPPGGLRLPGDCNDDGEINLSDAVCIFGVLFLGVPELFPCGDGTPADAGNVSLLDWQPDGVVNLSDGVANLTYLFNGGPPHALAVEGEEATACVRVMGCESSLSCSK